MTLWVSHRGESYDAPENTLSAFKLARERNTDAWETDIHFTGDKVVVCCHDASTARVSGVEKIVAECTFDELQQVDVSNGKAGYEGERIPAFAEVLKLLPPEKLLFTEIKINDPAIVDAMMDEIDRSPVEREQIIVISFHADMIKVCKERYPGMKALYLHGLGVNEDGTFAIQPEELWKKLEDMHADGLDARARKEFLTPEFVAELRKRGYSLALWTIDDPETAGYFIDTVKPDAVTSNRAAYLCNIIDHGANC